MNKHGCEINRHKHDGVIKTLPFRPEDINRIAESAVPETKLIISSFKSIGDHIGMKSSAKVQAEIICRIGRIIRLRLPNGTIEDISTKDFALMRIKGDG